MRRDSLFWGSALILLGVLLYLQTQGTHQQCLSILLAHRHDAGGDLAHPGCILEACTDDR